MIVDDRQGVQHYATEHQSDRWEAKLEGEQRKRVDEEMYVAADGERINEIRNAVGLCALRSLLIGNSCLLAHGGNDGNNQLLSIRMVGFDLCAEVAFGQLDVILFSTLSRHKVEEAVFLDVHEGVFLSLDVGDVHVVGRGTNIFQLLAGEDVGGNEMDLSMSVLASLGGRHVDDLAGTTLDHNVSTFAERAALHRVCKRRSGGSASLELVLLILFVAGRHDSLR